VRNRSVGVRGWARLLGLETTVVEAVEEEDGAIVISVARHIASGIAARTAGAAARGMTWARAVGVDGHAGW
jgi:hypothetical protein